MNTINDIWREQTGGKRYLASMVDGVMIVTERPNLYGWRVIVRGIECTGVAGTQQEAMSAAEAQYADLHINGKP